MSHFDLKAILAYYVTAVYLKLPYFYCFYSNFFYVLCVLCTSCVTFVISKYRMEMMKLYVGRSWW